MDTLCLPIRSVEVFGVAVPLVGPGFRNAYIVKKAQKSAIVRLVAEDGSVGLGNIDPSPGYSVETIEQSLRALREQLAVAVQGQDAGNPHRILQRMDQTLAGHLDAKAAIEMACIDLISRRLGIPVHQYLGGKLVDEVCFNAWIGIVPPDEAAVEARKWFDRGFRSAKIKVGGGIEADRDRVRAVREAVGADMALRADANAGYSVEDSIALGRLLEPLEMQLLEQPVAAEDLEGMARVRQAIGIPVMADESITDHVSLVAVIRANCADIVKLKVMKQGGFLGCRRMLETATAAGMKVVIGHGFGLGINTVAEIMLACTSTQVLEGLECVGPLKTSDDIVTRKLDLSSGRIAVPDGPGLGVTLDDNKVKQYHFDA
ncbi:L-Ala-D/L-Glu epimerase [Variovorax sp. PBL-H6]|uniref:mandelate racemase/muconate lactonizing enzyme family protein n=1 Tax=Variovorax sp. PBL-H6 TaxID=434009 RepID=UPI0013191F0A|nr:enolase C-terminal domain-like protein [Variovorax sp. PBL-H6]VTU23710.1 L-Ala-D/L-Glu epimerase [Variovorax sp. PBL-H6]